MPKLILLFFLSLCISGYGQNPDSLLVVSPGTTLSIGSLNDSYNGAFTANRDDYRSFGFDLTLNYQNKLFGYSSYNGYTNRSRKDTTNEGRLDELLFMGEYEIWKYKTISILPVIGLVFSGDMGGADIQNSIHEDVDEPIVNLPYDYEGIKTSLLFGIQLNHRIILDKVNPQVFIKNEMSFVHALDYGDDFNLGSYLILGKEPGTHFSFSIFYQYKDFWASPTLEAISSQESGLRLGFKQDVSIFTLGYEAYPFSGFGYGRIGVNLLKTKDDQEYKKADVIVDFKALLDRGGYYSNYKWEMLEVKGHKVNASIGHMYGTYTSNVIEAHPQARGQYFQLNFGVESYVFELKPKWQVSPYLGAGMGFKIESTFSGQNPDINTQNNTSALAYADAGVRLGGPVRMISKSTLLGIVVGDIVSLPFSSQQQELPGQTLSVLEIKNNFYVGFNFVIDM
ncbi:hypothetical protein [Reichenbachiella sp.]|uniref:hypothetical protein n=1 Tax=Reichenbachiella sp. TaxID=2184521 RepID=UPI003BAF25C9